MKEKRLSLHTHLCDCGRKLRALDGRSQFVQRVPRRAVHVAVRVQAPHGLAKIPGLGLGQEDELEAGGRLEEVHLVRVGPHGVEGAAGPRGLRHAHRGLAVGGRVHLGLRGARSHARAE